jgi:hypothetical protein
MKLNNFTSAIQAQHERTPQQSPTVATTLTTKKAPSMQLKKLHQCN